jgi:2-C-methyl-D-erythritol 4-phosphate cytidylyltransferase
MKASVILLAAGRGERMDSAEPKAFLRLAGKTLLERAVETVDECPDVRGFVVVAPAGHEQRVAHGIRSSKLLSVVAGGSTRQESVRLGLQSLPVDFDVVLCHDVARPLASPELFRRALDALPRHGSGAVPVVPVTDAIHRVGEGDGLESVPREGLFAAQTPQGFDREKLEKAHLVAADQGIVAADDAELIERAGLGSCGAFPGEPTNIKITRPEDLRMAEALLSDG